MLWLKSYNFNKQQEIEMNQKTIEHMLLAAPTSVSTTSVSSHLSCCLLIFETNEEIKRTWLTKPQLFPSPCLRRVIWLFFNWLDLNYYLFIVYMWNTISPFFFLNGMSFSLTLIYWSIFSHSWYYIVATSFHQSHFFQFH